MEHHLKMVYWKGEKFWLGKLLERQRHTMAAVENPMQVRIQRGIERGAGVPGACEQALRHRPLDLGEIRGFAPCARHHLAREKNAEDRAPAPVVPLAEIESFTLGPRA